MNNEIEKREYDDVFVALENSDKLNINEKFEKSIKESFKKYDETFRLLAATPDIELEKILVEKFGEDPNRKHASF